MEDPPRAAWVTFIAAKTPPFIAAIHSVSPFFEGPAPGVPLPRKWDKVSSCLQATANARLVIPDGHLRFLA